MSARDRLRGASTPPRDADPSIGRRGRQHPTFSCRSVHEGSRRCARAGTIRAPGDQADDEALADPLIEPLTARELDILRLMARGRSSAEIAAELVVSLTTVKWHVGNVLGRLGVSSRTRALVRAQRLGLV